MYARHGSMKTQCIVESKLMAYAHIIAIIALSQFDEVTIKNADRLIIHFLCYKILNYSSQDCVGSYCLNDE